MSTLLNGPPAEMRLYCWQHKANHTLPLADVERIVYALAWAERDALANDEFEVNKTTPTCPLVMVTEWAADPALYADVVTEGVECRAAAGEWTA